ncbi:hypothetical protein HDV05_008291 [Chytridiales sp. JEL 0842]|nr:hypothetical protein HDV05_008291 [Chytridiales sp. JEL 0842]
MNLPTFLLTTLALLASAVVAAPQPPRPPRCTTDVLTYSLRNADYILQSCNAQVDEALKIQCRCENYIPAQQRIIDFCGLKGDFQKELDVYIANCPKPTTTTEEVALPTTAV